MAVAALLYSPPFFDCENTKSSVENTLQQCTASSQVTRQ